VSTRLSARRPTHPAHPSHPSAGTLELQIIVNITNCSIVEPSESGRWPTGPVQRGPGEWGMGDGECATRSALRAPALGVGRGIISDRTWPHQKQQSRSRWLSRAATGQFGLARCSSTQPPSRLLSPARGRGTDAHHAGGVAAKPGRRPRGRPSHSHRASECVKEAHEVRRGLGALGPWGGVCWMVLDGAGRWPSKAR
jgi:hypothetical protein